MHLVPAPVYQRKLASLRAADEFGRRQARDRITLHMAKEAGKILATQSYEDFLKEAGLFSRLGGAIQKGVGKLLPKAKPKPISGRAAAQKSRAAAAAQPKPPLAPKTRAAAQQQYLQKNIQRAQDKGVQKAAPATTAGPQVAPGPAAAPATAPAAGSQRVRIEQTPQGARASRAAGAGPTPVPESRIIAPSGVTGARQPVGSVAQGPARGRQMVVDSSGRVSKAPLAPVRGKQMVVDQSGRVSRPSPGQSAPPSMSPAQRAASRPQQLTVDYMGRPIRPAAPAPAQPTAGTVAPGPAAKPVGQQRIQPHQQVQATPMQTGQAGQRPYAFEAGARHGRQPAGTVAQGPAARGGPRQAGDATPVPGTGESAAQYAGQFDRALGAGGAVSVPVAQRSAAQAVGGVAPGPASRGAQAGVKTRTVDASAGVRRRKGKDIGKVEQRKAKAESKQQGQQKAKADEDAARAAAQEQGTVAAGGGKPTGQEPPEGPQAAPEKTPGILPFMWRNRVPLAVGGGLAGAYGVAKGVPWAARQLEQSSMTPMAHGGGWSPVGYGYGQNPFGAATGGYMGPGG